MPHGAGVLILSKKSKAKSLAIGKFKRTWPWHEIAKNDIRTTISNLPQCIIYLFQKTHLCLYQTILTTKFTHIIRKQINRTFYG